MDPHSGYCALVAGSSPSERGSSTSRPTSKTLRIGGKIRTVRVPDELWEEAQRIAAQRGETLSEVIRRLLEQYINEAEEE